MTLKTQWILLAVFAALPYLVLGAAGSWWLYESGWLLWWLIGTGLISLIGWPLVRWLNKRNPLTMPSSAGPGQDWSPTARAAWAEVEIIARRKEIQDIPLDRPEPLINLAKEVVETVAKQFKPRSKRPVLEIPVPQLLRIVELVAHDLRDACSANIPGSHILTINDLVKLKKIVNVAPSLYRVYRVFALVVNPATALAREFSTLTQERMLSASTVETKRWALEFAIRKTGFYAIELYSGQLVLRGVEFASYTTKQSSLEVHGEQRRTQALEREPLRVLILGQVKAGKSSLVNALFGETRAAVDVVPRTKGIDAYLLERDGIKQAIILDTAGYDEASQSAIALDRIRKEVMRCDLVLMVSSAQNAARDVDFRLLSQVRSLFQSTPDREFPPLLVALTHIDLLRPFREWSPPYNLIDPQGIKAQQIREAIEVTASELQVDIERVIPVCLRKENIYNVEEGLVPAILDLLGSAERLKVLRCLREYKAEEYWRQLRQQAANAGRILLKTGIRMLGNKRQ